MVVCGMNKISLIIPDIHHRWEKAEKIIASVKHDEVIFLGDFFDDFDDTPEMVEATCDWLNSSVKKPNRIHLFGNHDVHYAFPYRGWKCSGYDQWKDFIVTDNVTRATWDKLKWYHVLDGTWLLSHAGLHKSHVPEAIRELHTNRLEFIAAIEQYLDVEIVEGFRKAAKNEASWVFGAGRSRGGMHNVGGIIWCDFAHEFHPVTGLNQIFGHTPMLQGSPVWSVLDEQTKRPAMRVANLWTPLEKRIQDPNDSVNIDLDVRHRTHYATWNGKVLQVGSLQK